MRLIKPFVILFLLITALACSQKSENKEQLKFNIDKEKNAINLMLDSFNVAAGKADFDGYFNFYTEDAIFTGTDATERWDKKEFMVWAKPIFDRGKAWNFTALKRNIYFSKNGDLAWFDELLNTQMKICRGSGVLVKEGNHWKVQQYILSTTVPNPILDEVIKMKTSTEDSLINQMKR
jgi:ketosteroid isomerase-like protein